MVVGVQSKDVRKAFFCGGWGGVVKYIFSEKKHKRERGLPQEGNSGQPWDTGDPEQRPDAISNGKLKETPLQAMGTVQGRGESWKGSLNQQPLGAWGTTKEAEDKSD